MHGLVLTVSLVCLGGASSPPVQYQNTPVFNIRSKPVDGDDVSDILLQYYDERAARWMGYGLFAVSRMADGTVRARITFEAPYEGMFRLRTLASDRAGNVEPAGDDPSSAKMIAVYDATAPVVEMIFPRGGEQISAPGSILVRWMAQDAHIASEQAVQVLFSSDGGISFTEVMPWSGLCEEFEYTLPDITTYRAVVMVRVRDLAGNVGEARSGLFTIVGSRKMETPAAGDQKQLPEPVPSVAVPSMEAAGVRKPAPPEQARKPVPENRRMAKRAYTRGVIYLVRGDYDEAVKELSDALSFDPDFLPARVDLGVALVKLGRMREALEFLENSVRQYPDDPDLSYNTALIYYRVGDVEEALRFLRKTLLLAPDRLDVLWLAAECAASVGDMDSAVQWWLKIVQMTPASDRYHRKSLAYLEKAGVNVDVIENVKGKELVSEPARAVAAPVAPAAGPHRDGVAAGKGEPGAGTPSEGKHGKRKRSPGMFPPLVPGSNVGPRIPGLP